MPSYKVGVMASLGSGSALRLYSRVSQCVWKAKAKRQNNTLTRIRFVENFVAHKIFYLTLCANFACE
jgi:hypothetical protein